VRFPNGESFKSAQRRAVTAIEAIARTRGKKTHLIVSHSDIIKLVSARLLGMKLDDFQSIQIAPASFTIFAQDKGKFSLITSNNSSSLKEILG
jgi:broad specificity phosphatase PhoE